MGFNNLMIYFTLIIVKSQAGDERRKLKPVLVGKESKEKPPLLSKRRRVKRPHIEELANTP